MTTETSHGRGGAGNFNVDDTKYVDGEVVRSGVEGSHGDGAYSSGRGGAGNIGDVGTAVAPRADQDVIPEGAYRTSEQGDHHTGRGGAGNEIHTNGSAAKDGSAPISLADKLKSKVLGIFKK